jgi:hypothetical protein
MNDDISHREISYLAMKAVGVGEVEEGHRNIIFIMYIL